MEGAIMQARARGSLEPFDASVGQLRNYIDGLMAQAASTGQPGTGEKERARQCG
jgi:hypothetical protein